MSGNTVEIQNVNGKLSVRTPYLVRDVPRRTIVREQGPDREALEAERAQLKARLNEIETTLAKLDGGAK